jgi:hypothetical protein
MDVRRAVGGFLGRAEPSGKIRSPRTIDAIAVSIGVFAPMATA